MIYFDNSATTFVSEAVKSELIKLTEDQVCANPGSLHKLGTKAMETYEGIRRETASLLGAKSEEIFLRYRKCKYRHQGLHEPQQEGRQRRHLNKD